MKKIALLSILLLTSLNLTSQDFIIEESKCFYSGKKLSRTFKNYVLMLEASNQNFENLMNKIGAKIQYGKNFSILAFEQISSDGASMNNGELSGLCNLLMYEKSSAGVGLNWLGKSSYSEFKELVSYLKPYYVGEKNDYQTYITNYQDKRIAFVISRKYEGNNMYSESVSIFYPDDINR
jgi:hypothetical protein